MRPSTLLLVGFLVLRLACDLRGSETEALDDQSLALSDAERLLSEIKLNGEYPSIDVLTKPLSKEPRSVVESALTTVLTNFTQANDHCVWLAIELAQAFDAPKVRECLLQLVESEKAPVWAVGRAAVSLGVIGDARVLPVVDRRFRTTTDSHLKSVLLTCMQKFQELAIPLLRSLARTESETSIRMDLLGQLVSLDDAWAAKEFSRAEYSRAELFRRLQFWRREVRLRELKTAVSSKAAPGKGDAIGSPMPPDYRAPFER